VINNANNNIGLRIRQLRYYFKLTQSDFSEKIGAKQANLSHMERRGEKISIEIITSIISNFNINANWLLIGNGEMLLHSPEQSEQNDEYKENILIC
jgi:transcriptional regulator with XRE-family HTH domain